MQYTYNKSLQDERLNRVLCKIAFKCYIASELVNKTYPYCIIEKPEKIINLSFSRGLMDFWMYGLQLEFLQHHDLKSKSFSLLHCWKIISSNFSWYWHDVSKLQIYVFTWTWSVKISKSLRSVTYKRLHFKSCPLMSKGFAASKYCNIWKNYYTRMNCFLETNIKVGICMFLEN